MQILRKTDSGSLDLRRSESLSISEHDPSISKESLKNQPDPMMIKRLIAMLPLLAVLCGVAGNSQESRGVRRPAVAGQFYPSTASHLKLAIEAFMKDAMVPAAAAGPLALVVPHAGYVYSGQICADAYRQAARHPYDVVVILGTNHTAAGFEGISVYSRGAYRTPLGDMPVDEPVAAALLAQDPDCTTDTTPQINEHSVEVQVPFVQSLFPKARIVPVVIGEPAKAMCEHFGQVLARVLQNRRALIVASSDLSHYAAYDDAARTDRQILDAIARLNTAAFIETARRLVAANTANLVTCACGEAPILAAMTAAKAMGAKRGVVVSYANSGDALLGDRTRVVGYGAVAFFPGESEPDLRALEPMDVPARGVSLQHTDKKALLTIARESIRRYLTTETLPLVRRYTSSLAPASGVFVTLKKNGKLRGCIGHIAAEVSLARTVGAMAAQAAFNDSRFRPVTATELPEIEIEISVLTHPEAVNDPEAIQVGRDGIILHKDGRSAVFLPQVATEYGWGRNEMLDNLCRKAGLREGSWKQGARLLTFQADVFSESTFR
jgi:AmmeMemoRadiSam system protein B/AmmeMemoRadiSam system protein A